MHRKIGGTSDHLFRSQSGDTQDDFINYNTVPFDIDDSYCDNDTAHRESVVPGSRRWSILEKLERSCREFRNILSFKCCFATSMLLFFVLLAVSFAHAMFNIDSIGPDRFDFIIVGAGPAGSVLSRMLSDAGASTLVIEAGTNTQYDLGGKDYFGGPVTRFDIPLLWPSTSYFSEYRWQGFNIPDIFIGKCLGGSDVHSAMTYVRALSSDIDKWNIKGWTWTWERVLETYKEVEKYSPEKGSSLSSLQYHGVNGEIPTERLPYLDSISSDFISSAVHAGINFTSDFNDPEGREGVGNFHFHIKGGTRMSTARVMLSPIIGTRPKFKMELGATVRRILLADLPLSATSAGIKVAHSNKSKSRDTTEDVGVEDHSVSMNLFHVLCRWTSWSDRNTCNTDDTANSKKKVKAEYSRKADPNGRRSFTDWYKSSVSFLYAPTELPTNVPPEEVRYRAVGVEYEQNGVLKSVYLKSSLLHIETAAFGKRGVRSIILAAGAIMTPKLLMNSGIGPEDVLKEAGVDMLVASELVGRNLHDHPAVGLTFMRLEGEVSPSAYTMARDWGQYVDTVAHDRAGKGVNSKDFGVMGSTGLSAAAFLTSPFSARDGVPDLQLTFYAEVIEPRLILTSDKLQPGSTPSAILRNGSQMLVTVALLSPDARLRVYLNVSDPVGSTPHILHAECPFRKEVVLNESSEVELGGIKSVSSHRNSSISSGSHGNGSRSDHSHSPSKCPVGGPGGTNLNGPHYLSQLDVDRITWGAEQVRRIFLLSPLALSTGPEISPGIVVATTQDMREWVRANVYSSSHWVGTAQMGNLRNESVVDERLCVWGVENLMVADASAIPIIPAGVHSTVVMVATTASKLILSEARLE